MIELRLVTSGIRALEQRINQRIKALGQGHVRGTLKAAQFIHRKADETVPIKTGNLAASGVARIVPGDRSASEVAYLADYAAAVHENVEANFRRPRARAKFLELAFRENEDEIVRIIAEDMEGA